MRARLHVWPMRKGRVASDTQSAHYLMQTAVSAYILQTVLHSIAELTPLSCIACMTICCSVHKSALTHKEIIFSTFSNQQALCICICLISCTESETYAHVVLRDGGPVFRAPLCTKQSLAGIIFVASTLLNLCVGLLHISL